MKILNTLILVILIFLSASAGIMKVLLMQQDVDFFGKYGMSGPILVAFGVVQLMGGILLVFKQTRFVGAALVAITFLVSLIFLMLDGKTIMAIATSALTLFSLQIMKQSWDSTQPNSRDDSKAV